MTESVLVQIAETGAHQTRKSDALDQTVALTRASIGAGEALATLLIDHVQEQAGKLRLYVQSLTELDANGRSGFIDTLTVHIRQMKAHVAATSPDGKYKNGDPIYRMACSSAIVRLSEFTQIARALNMEFVIDLSQNYHTIIAQARKWIEEHTGKKETRGRPKTHAIVKALKYIHSQIENAIDDGDVAALNALEAMAENLCKEMGLVKEQE